MSSPLSPRSPGWHRAAQVDATHAVSLHHNEKHLAKRIKSHLCHAGRYCSSSKAVLCQRDPDKQFGQRVTRVLYPLPTHNRHARVFRVHGLSQNFFFLMRGLSYFKHIWHKVSLQSLFFLMLKLFHFYLASKTWLLWSSDMTLVVLDSILAVLSKQDITGSPCKISASASGYFSRSLVLGDAIWTP